MAPVALSPIEVQLALVRDHVANLHARRYERRCPVCAAPTRVRTFDFEPGFTASQMARAIRAALEDEGLELAAWQGARVQAFRVDGVDRVAIPLARIMPAL